MNVQHQVSLRDLNTMGIDVRASELYTPNDESELIEILTKFNRERSPYYLLGNGSNIIFASKNIKTPIIDLRSALNSLNFYEDNIVESGASIDIRNLIRACIDKSLHAPVELLTIPATVGGAIYMNAGRTSLKTTISDGLVNVRYYDGNNVKTIESSECDFRHRYSIFHKHKNWTILGAKFRYETKEKDYLKKEFRASLKWGNDKSYRTKKSAGSIFKSCDYKLMQRLEGLKIGDAELPKNTTNCIINNGNAKYWQILLLINIVKLAHAWKRKKCVLEWIVWK